jgi:hypothetical protein
MTRMRALLAALLLAGACTTVRPPDRVTLREPCPVVLLRSAGHLALVLPDGAGGSTRFGFGDREYMSDFAWTQYPRAFVLVLVGFLGEWTTGAMERIDGAGRSVDALASDSTMERHDFVVEKSLALALHARLQSKCGAPHPTCSWLVETDDRYSVWWDNCQSAVAGWCRELGCEVDRFRIVPRWAGFDVEAAGG